MTQMTIHVGNYIGSVMVFVGAWTLAQASLDNVERYIGGSIIIVVGAFIIRWVLKTSERVEATWSGALVAANDRAERAEARCLSLQKRLDEMGTKYATERSLRLSLEERGLTDRRKSQE